MDRESGEAALIGVFTTDRELIVRVWDEAMGAMTGISSSEAVGKHLTELIPDISSRGLLERFERVRNLGTSEVLSPAFHKFLIPSPPRVPSQHFDQMQQLVKIAPLRKDEDTCGLVVVVEDVTGRLVREREIARRLKDPDDSVRLEAAKDISMGSDPLSAESAGAVISSLGDKNWRVRRKLVEGLSRRMAPDAVAALLNAFRNDHLDFGLLNSALQVLQATSVDTTQTLADFLRGDDPDLRVQAALALGEQKNSTPVPALIAALDDENANVRYHAIEALGKLRASEAVERLLAIAETRDFFLAFPALEALGKIGDPSVAARIIPILDDDHLREAAVETLAFTGDAEAAGPIVERLNDGKLAVRAAASALTHLYRRFENDVEAAVQIADRIRRGVGPDAAHAVAIELDHVKDASGREVIHFAGWMDDAQVREKLGSLVEYEVVREGAVKALKAQGSAATEQFIGMLRSRNVEVRKAAAEALAEANGSDALEALIESIHSDPEIAPVAAHSLGKSSDPRAFDTLIGLLSTDDKVLHRSAAGALRTIAKSEMSSRLCGFLTETDPKVREAIVRIIGDLRTKECEDAIYTACGDTDGSVRAAALEQLPNFAGDNAISKLVLALKDGKPQVRATAARVLGRFDGGKTVEALRSALSDTDAWTRYFAVRSLAAINDPESYELFKDLSEQDEAEQVRVAAAEAIAGR